METTAPTAATEPELTVQSELDIPPAHAAFRAWCKERRGRRLGLAKLLGLSPGTVGSWGRRDDPRRPREAFHLLVINEVTGIHIHGWLTRAELTKLEPIAVNFQHMVVSGGARREKTDSRQMHLDYLLTNNVDAAGEADIDQGSDEADDSPFDVDAFTQDSAPPAAPAAPTESDAFDVDACS